MAAVDLDHLSVHTGGTVRLSEVTMRVPDGAVVGIVGGSGSGKTSLLRAIAGLDRVHGGEVRFDGRSVTHLAPGDRNVAMVFQSPVLIGHLSARGNVSFPLDVRRVGHEEIRQRVDAEVRALHIEDLMQREPATLSVGEQQLVQIARSLVRVPTVLLLDEPFASLDERLRRRLRRELAVLQSGYGVTTFIATNDSADIEALADVVAVLDDGRLLQVGERAVVRRAPVNMRAAAATGPLSLIDMTVVSEQRGFWLQREDPAGGELVRLRSWGSALDRYVGETVTVGVRPEDVDISSAGSIPAVVERAVPVGSGGITCTVAGARLTVTPPHGQPPPVGTEVWLRVHHHVVFDRVEDRAVS